MFPAKKSSHAILKDVHCIIKFLFGLHILVFEKLRDNRFGYTGTEVLFPRTVLVAFGYSLSFFIFQTFLVMVSMDGLQYIWPSLFLKNVNLWNAKNIPNFWVKINKLL